MSIGYIPKKVLRARRHKRLKKRYKNFSCLTCKMSDNFCWERIKRTPRLRSPTRALINVQHCPYWKASWAAKKVAKVAPRAIEAKKKKSFKEAFKSIF